MLKFVCGIGVGAWLGFALAAFLAVTADEKRRSR